MKRTAVLIWLSAILAPICALAGPNAWQEQTLGPQMLTRGTGAAPWLKNRVVEFQHIAGGLGFQVYHDSNNLYLHHFNLVGHGAI